MCIINNSEDTQSTKRQPWLLAHLTKWKPLYETTGVFSVIVAIIIGSCSIRQTRESLSFTQKAIDLQEKEFKLRNRPVVVITNPRFAGTDTDGLGRVWPYSIALDIENVSDIPATNVFAESEIYLNGKKIVGSKIAVGVIIRGRVEQTGIFLTKEIYDTATNEQNLFECQLKTKYSGMFGEKADQYESIFSFRYTPQEKGFSYLTKSFR